ncbi:hypothetical protein E3J85_01115 [Patescibacteria group bacterium]|nr:MAG: hypothetical protein E3J85_01115 [Patescibacteria group bacterium]
MKIVEEAKEHKIPVIVCLGLEDESLGTALMSPELHKFLSGSSIIERVEIKWGQNSPSEVRMILTYREGVFGYKFFLEDGRELEVNEALEKVVRSAPPRMAEHWYSYYQKQVRGPEHLLTIMVTVVFFLLLGGSFVDIEFVPKEIETSP